MSNAYITPTGMDESLLDYPLEYEHLREEGISLHKHAGVKVLKGMQYTARTLDELNKRMRNNEACNFVVTGEPGTGKTYFAKRLAQLLDPNFYIGDVPTPDPEDDKSQMAFTLEHLYHLTGNNTPLKRGSALIIDEANFTLSSRDWNQSSN